MKKVWMLVMVLCLALATQHAAAKRFGGGLSFGKQSNRVTQRQATPPAAPAATPQKAASPTGTPNTGNRFGGMLGGLAAGLGLAWLAHSLGFGEGFANILMVLLLVAAGVFVFRLMAHGRARPVAQGADGSYAPVPGYNEKNVGNDSAARPWESTNTSFQSANSGGGSVIGSALLGNQTWGVPDGFDTMGFLTACKRNFTNLQGAWDRADIPALRALMTDEMLQNIEEQLAEREALNEGKANVTEVVHLDAQMLGIEEVEGHYMASVEFNGLIREQADASPTPFREVWNVTRPVNGPGGWLVAGVQALG